LSGLTASPSSSGFTDETAFGALSSVEDEGLGEELEVNEG